MAQRVASGCLVFHDGNCLLLRRSALEDTMQGLWEMPAGKIESDLDGSPKENAIRETLEEAGIALGNVVPLGEHLTETKRFYGFLGVSDTADVELSFEHDAFVWMSTPDILTAVAADEMMVGHHTIYFLQQLLDGAEGFIYEAEDFYLPTGRRVPLDSIVDFDLVNDDFMPFDLDGVAFIPWSEGLFTMPLNCGICNRPSQYYEDNDNVCIRCSSEWTYDEFGEEGEGYYRNEDNLEAETFAAESGDVRINYNANCPACISIMSLIGEEKLETDPAGTYWGEGAYQNEVEHLMDGSWDFGDGQGRVQLHEPLLNGGTHQVLLGLAAGLLHDYNNNGNGNILEMGENEECYECSGTGDYDCYSDCDYGKQECYNCDGTGDVEDEEGEEEVCDDCDGSGEEDCSSCDGQTYCQMCGGMGEVWNEEIVSGISRGYQMDIDTIYAYGDYDISEALDSLVEGLESGQLRTTYGQEMYNDANHKLYNDLHDAIVYYVINTPNKPLPEGDTLDAETFAADSCIECGRKEGSYTDTVLIACPGCPELTCQHCYDEEKQGCVFCIRKRAETFSAEKITKEELVEYLDWLEEGEHYVFDSSPRAKRFHDLLAGNLQINSADVDFMEEDEFILLGAEEIPMGIAVKSFKTTSKIYYNRKLVKQFYGPRHREKADSIAGHYARKVQKNPNYFNYLRYEAEEYTEDSTFDTDVAIAQSLFALVTIRDLLMQNMTDEALEFINGEYLPEERVDEIIDDDLRAEVQAFIDSKSPERFEAEFVSLNNPFKYSGNYVENLEQDLNQAKRVIKMVREICRINVNVDWISASITPSEEFENIVEIIDEKSPANFESESFNYPQGGIYETNMSRQNMSQLSRRDYLKMIRAGHQPVDIRMVYDRLMCSHDSCDQNDVWTFDEYEDGSTFAVDIQWLCPDCGALGEVTDFDFDSYDEFWGTDPNLYPVMWYTKRGRRPEWTPEELEIVDLMPVSKYSSHYAMMKGSESLTGKDMSYCKCGTNDEVGGFTCGQHCSRIEKNGETFEARFIRSLNTPRQPMPWDLEPNMAEEGMPYLTRREYDTLIRIGYTEEEIRKGYQRSYEAESTELGNLIQTDVEIKVYVPTTWRSRQLSELELRDRVKDVEEKFARWFGGFTTTEADGGYMDENDNLISEQIFIVSAWVNHLALKEYGSILSFFLKNWREQWDQEVIGFEFNNQFHMYPLSNVDYDDLREFMKVGNYTDSLLGNLLTLEAESTRKPARVEITRATIDPYKLTAVFYDKDDKKIKTTHFGDERYEDYTIHKDKERLKNYNTRHGAKSAGEKWQKPMTAGALSKWILWNKPSLKASFDDYKRRFKLKGDLKAKTSGGRKRAEGFEDKIEYIIFDRKRGQAPTHIIKVMDERLDSKTLCGMYLKGKSWNVAGVPAKISSKDNPSGLCYKCVEKQSETFATEYTPSQTLGEYDARELALSSVATGDFFTDSLKFSTTRKASEEYNEDNQKMQEAAEKIMEILGEPDSKISKPGSFYASLGEPYTLDMVYVLEYEVLTDDGPKDTWNFGLQMARKLRQQGTEPWSDDRWTGGSPTYAAGAFHLERETFTVTVLEANPAVESVVMDLHQYFADKYGVNGTGFEPAYTVALDEAGNAITADDIEIDTTWRDSMRGFESEEEDAKKLREYEKTYGKKQAKIRMRLKKKIYKERSMGTKAGQWSARKSQKLKREYEKACERAGLKPYKTGKTEKQEDLEDWSDQDWKTSSGKKSSKTGEPYFPAKAVEALKKKGLYAKAKRQKAKATKAGKQNARYSDDIRKVVAKYRAESFQADTDVVLYFGTSTQFLTDIERFGLSDPMLTLDLAVADDYAMATAEQYGGNAIVVEVSAFADLLDRVDWQGNIFEYFGDIPPAALYVMDWDDRTGSWS